MSNFMNHKIVLIGDSGVGKTSIFNRFDTNTYMDHYQMTVGGGFSNIEVRYQGQPVLLGIWDTAGQERFRNIVPMYFDRAEIILLVFDLTNPESFDNLREWVTLAQDKASQDVVFLVIGNKSDLYDERKINLTSMETFASSITTYCPLEVSAKNGNGIEQALNYIAEIVSTRNIQQYTEEPINIGQQMSNSNSQNKSCC